MAVGLLGGLFPKLLRLWHRSSGLWHPGLFQNLCTGCSCSAGLDGRVWGGQEGTRMLEVGHRCATPWGRLHRVGAGQVCVLAWGCIRGKMFSSPAAVSGLARRSSLMQVAV